MTLDHIGFAVKDFKLSRKFYVNALAPLGITVVMEGENWAMMGKNGKGAFWFGTYGQTPGPIHLAFEAEGRKQVKAFHLTATNLGAKDNGAPGLRPQYHPNYYAAFVIDPNGHNLEAVCHHYEPQSP